MNVRTHPFSPVSLALACAFSSAALAQSAPAPASQPASAQHTWALVLHGGAGAITRASMTPEADAAYRAGIREALTAAAGVLDRGGSSLDAIEAAIKLFEDNPLFNAGRGAVFAADGTNQLDAAIMDGATMRAGSVADVRRTRHPISLARAVMEKSPYVMLIDSGADDFAAHVHLEQVPPSFFFTERRWQDLVRQLEKDVNAARFEVPEGKIELPVKLKVYESIFVPLAKWSMLLAGNYRCITKDGMRTAKEAVHTNIEESKSVYNFVFDLCVKLGANPNDLVPFEKYAAAAQSLSRPASAARALFNGAPNIERCDKLVQLIARQKGLSHPVIDANVALVDELLDKNRKKEAV